LSAREIRGFLATDNRRLLEVTATLPTGYTFHNFNFTYDKVGNVTSLQNTALPPPLWLSSTEANKGDTLYGPGTPFPTREAYRDFQIRLQQAREAR